jgi:hypothetical protein
MMLPRLAPLALVMVAACSRPIEQSTPLVEPVTASKGAQPQEPNYSACKLVGSWRCVIPKPDIPGGSGPIIFEEIFRANGQTLCMSDYYPWVLVSDDGQRVVIEYPRDVPYAKQRQRTFEFDGNDRMHEIEAVARPRTWERFRGPE